MSNKYNKSQHAYWNIFPRRYDTTNYVTIAAQNQVAVVQAEISEWIDDILGSNTLAEGEDFNIETSQWKFITDLYSPGPFSWMPYLHETFDGATLIGAPFLDQDHKAIFNSITALKSYEVLPLTEWPIHSKQHGDGSYWFIHYERDLNAPIKRYIKDQLEHNANSSLVDVNKHLNLVGITNQSASSTVTSHTFLDARLAIIYGQNEFVIKK